MADVQAELNGASKRHSPVSGFAGQAANVLGDLLELAELQARLAKSDAHLTFTRMTRPVAVLLVGICAALASLPVLTIGLASCLDALTVLNAWQAQLLIGLLVAAVAVMAIYLSVKSIRRSALQFERSASELARNIAWLKSILGSSHSSIKTGEKNYE
ncbi:MAG: phage holin family protein [Pirellulaceae bacterium]|nr:phage holin family protein [Pirellulaceae bacterium]